MRQSQWRLIPEILPKKQKTLDASLWFPVSMVCGPGSAFVQDPNGGVF